MKVTEATLDEVFSYHKATPEQIEIMDNVRVKCKALAKAVLQCPDSDDREVALRCVREVSLWANASVILG